MPLCEIIPTREIILICFVNFVYFVAESFYTIYMFYTAKNPCVTMTDSQFVSGGCCGGTGEYGKIHGEGTLT